MVAALKILLLIVAGVVAFFITEIGVMVWLTFAPNSLGLAGHYLTASVLPVVVLVAILAALVLWKILAASPIRNGTIFSSVFVAVEVYELLQRGNPPLMIAGYAAIVLCVCAVVFITFARLFWSRKPTTDST